ncbi:MAG: IPT/TIG domain-containing protein, partial [Candidatus Sericytochromatia bacterium]
MRLARPLPLLIACTLLGACMPGVPTAPTGKKIQAGASQPKADQTDTAIDTDAATPALSAYTGQVLGLDGQPAAGVSIKSYIIATGGGNIISTGGGNIIATGGGNIISTGGGNIISTGGGNYRVLSAGEVKTDADGTFSLDLPATAAVNLEAIQAENVKAIQLEVKREAGPVKLQLAKTGTITGKVTAPDATSVTDFTGVDVFIPGTGYVAKTDAAGTFTIPNVPVGSFALFAMKTGLGSALVQNVSVESEKTTTAPALPLTVKAPVIASIAPNIAGPGAEITITGDHFGAAEGKTFQVTFGGVIAEAPTRVDEKTIKVKVPASAGSGNLGVTVDGITSNGQPFTLLKSLDLTANPPQLVKGHSYTLTAQGMDGAEKALENPPVTWSVEGGAVSIDASGTVTANALGKATIKASSGTTTQTLEVEVFPFLYHATTVAGSGVSGTKNAKGAEAQFETLGGIARDASGQLYVSEPGRNTIRKIATDGTVSTFTSGVVDPWDLVFDQGGNLFVTERSANRISKVTPQGVVSHHAGKEDRTGMPNDTFLQSIFEAPGQMAFDSIGTLFLAERFGQESLSIRALETTLMVSTWSDAVNWTEQVPAPQGASHVCVDAGNNVYLAAGHRIYKVTPDRTPSILAGSEIQQSASDDSADGTGTDAQFSYIPAMAIDSAGNLYVADF